MSAILKNRWHRWNRTIPYIIDTSTFNDSEIVQLIRNIWHFNSKFEKPIFIERNPNRLDVQYVKFSKAGELSQSDLGKQPNAESQKISVKLCVNVYHEMGHCCGLGHTYFHSKSKLPSLFDNEIQFDLMAFDASKNKYEDFGQEYHPSMMNYTPSSFKSLRIQNIVKNINSKEELITPVLSSQSGSTFEFKGVQVYKSDFEIIKKYWVFCKNHEMRIKEADILAISRVTGMPRLVEAEEDPDDLPVIGYYLEEFDEE